MPLHPAMTRAALAAAVCLALVHAPAAKADDAPALPATAAAPNADGPKIEVGPLEWDFKVLPHGAKCEHEFQVRNTGKAPLKILSTLASCGCTVPTMAHTEIAPGQAEPLKVTYDSNRIGEFSKTVTVKSNDAASPSVVIHIKGSIVSDMTVQPQHGVRWPAPVERRAAAAAPQRVTFSTDKMASIAVQSVESSDPHLAWTIVKGPDARTQHLDLRLRPDTPVGAFNATLKVHTTSKLEPVTDIYVSADVVGDVHVMPTELYLSYREPSDILEGRITVSDAAMKGRFKLADVRDEGGLVELATETVTPGTEYAITARLKPGGHKPGLFSGNLVLATNQPGEGVLKVPYSGAVPVPDPSVLAKPAAASAPPPAPAAAPPAPSAAPSAAPAAGVATLPSGKSDQLTVITYADVQALLQQKAAQIVDARSPDRYAEGHIPGAMNFFVDDFNALFPKFEPVLPKSARIVVYCDGLDCPMAHDLGSMLLGRGYTNLLYYQKGWDEWLVEKAPVEKGAAAK